MEQVFSRASGLSDPHIDPLFLSALVMVSVNKKAYCPTVSAIRYKYYELFRGKGGASSSSSGERDDDDVEAAVIVEAREGSEDDD